MSRARPHPLDRHKQVVLDRAGRTVCTLNYGTYFAQESAILLAKAQALAIRNGGFDGYVVMPDAKKERRGR